MRVLVTTERHFIAGDDGIYTETTEGFSFWSRYLAAFDEVMVVARVSTQERPSERGSRADGDGVLFFPLPDYKGPLQYLRRLTSLRNRVHAAIGVDTAIILRVPGAVGGLVWDEVRREGRPYGVEVLGDPYDVFAPGSVKHPLRPLFRRWFSRRLRDQCVGACAAAYVTERALQMRYPPSRAAFATYYSDVELPDAAFVPVARELSEACKFRLIFVGSLAQLYKGPDVLIEAVGYCLRDGLDLELVLVGDGQYRSELEAKARRLGLGKRVHFWGKLPAGEAIQAQLDQSDIFVLPSRQEGLPRAMIEAMARALPCIGSTVGGIPELLLPEDMVLPGDSMALARKIHEVVSDPVRMRRMSMRNLEVARRYHEKVLQERRNKFYEHLRQRTEEWMRNRHQ